MPATYLRQATNQDLPEIKKIIGDAKAYLKQQEIDQWQNGYPSDEDLETDVKSGISYVLIIDGKIAATAALHQGLDVSYLKIHDGEWLNGVHGRYTAIHRIAMSSDFRGQHLSEKMISGLITISNVLGYKDVRIDTHPDNKGMQHVITTNGFTKRGTIYMEEADSEESPRYAYQLLIK
ncbi:MAG: GNAT family N-acetyltransferase [Lentilactobacillus diolivorans]|jgi:ribosomal protein S18 acetylase RimI-like enzyme|uniref:Acetyltransferase n=2 Tax=Lentilactobacillus diolivorans TaxID=179838 RepID=A0A0R1SE12_9LACO|nr:GNAT family N-acetyltransferase [Lentilactobacillus diolivorans]RRG00969.1 MAG: GNAT family N-acetyltransferase [Lactobacillus sp.]KRL64794.1 acetyltransferase [Lentilactobacillus diolivorans DSM 14421]MCH4164777.1 GNAT family N-acetyltransferase [Lentilactobacillus diolivorans]MDH5105645.1 GNAT family N-acetyltransferase [Lentilactobacillus diolivorans]GEP25347.1 N-acetyltransferase [Lentilactobacillus diolivorans]